MLKFIIGGTILGVVSGGVIGVLFAFMFPDTQRQKKVIIILASIFTFSVLCSFGLYHDSKPQPKPHKCQCECCTITRD